MEDRKEYEVAFTISTGTSKGVSIKDRQYTLPVKSADLWELHDAIRELIRNWRPKREE